MKKSLVTLIAITAVSLSTAANADTLTCQNRVAKLESKNSRLKNQIANLNTELNQCVANSRTGRNGRRAGGAQRTRVASLMQQLDALNIEVSELENENSNLSSQLIQCQNSRPGTGVGNRRNCRELKREVRELRAENSDLVNDNALLRDKIMDLQDQLNNRGGNGRNNGGNMEIYTCNTASDPQMIKSIVNSYGEVLRSKVIQTFVDGGDEDETADCRRAAIAANENTLNGINAECNCKDINGSGDPTLTLDILDRNYNTVATYNIGTFVEGGDEDEIKACEQAARTISFCSF